MTSSKSFRATMLPPSFSLSALRSNSDLDKRLRKFSLRDRRALEPIQPPQQRPRQHDGSVVLHNKEPLQEDDVPPPRRLRSKSRTWSARVSSFLPPLMSSTADPPPQTARRRATAGPQSPLPSPASKQLPATPADDAAASDTLDWSTSPSSSGLTAPPLPPRLDTGSVSLVSSPEATPVAVSATSAADFHAASLAQLESAAQSAERRSPPADGGTDSHRQSRLHKGARQSRRRSKSLQQLPLISEPRLVPGDGSTSPLELRGRRSFSAQNPSIVTDDAPGLRLTPPPATPGPSPSGAATRAPPGGGSAGAGSPAGSGLAPAPWTLPRRASCTLGSCPTTRPRPSTTRRSSKTAKR